MGLVELEVTTNIGSLISALENLESAINNIGELVGTAIISNIKHNVLNVMVRELASQAGPGFPTVYTDHLVGFLQQLELIPEISGSTFNLIIPLGLLGNESDLEFGYHDQAIIDGGEDFIHVAKVNLPYSGESLINDAERREEFWEQVIINRDVQGFIANSDYGNRTAQMQAALTTILGRTEIPTFGQIANRRVASWIGLGVAPEWLLLEYGSAVSGAEPVVEPVNFLERIEAACNCILEQSILLIEQGALEVFAREASAGQMVSVNAAGRPFYSAGQGSISGQFVEYKSLASNLLDNVDFAGCLEY